MNEPQPWALAYVIVGAVTASWHVFVRGERGERGPLITWGMVCAFWPVVAIAELRERDV